jgi:hypothetical protein
MEEVLKGKRSSTPCLLDLEKEKGWNKQQKIEYKARDYIYSHIMLDIKRGMKPKSKQLISSFLNERVDYHLESLKILEDISKNYTKQKS